MSLRFPSHRKPWEITTCCSMYEDVMSCNHPAMDRSPSHGVAVDPGCVTTNNGETGRFITTEQPVRHPRPLARASPAPLPPRWLWSTFSEDLLPKNGLMYCNPKNDQFISMYRTFNGFTRTYGFSGCWSTLIHMHQGHKIEITKRLQLHTYCECFRQCTIYIHMNSACVSTMYQLYISQYQSISFNIYVCLTTTNSSFYFCGYMLVHIRYIWITPCDWPLFIQS